MKCGDVHSEYSEQLLIIYIERFQSKLFTKLKCKNRNLGFEFTASKVQRESGQC